MRILIISAVIAAGATGAAGAATFSPDTATASSEFSASYAAENTIDGSGLPAPFDETDTHSTYAAGNHWTTLANQTIDAFITWGFGSPVTVGGVYIWNHLSDGVAANAYYAPTVFDLELFDAGSNSLVKLEGVSINPGVDTAQGFDMGGLFSNVSSATFTVKQTRYEAEGQSFVGARYTGLAEVLFTDERLSTGGTGVIPLPAAGWLLLSGLLGLGLLRRQRAG